MLRKLKAFANALFRIPSNTATKTIVDSRFGKLTCEFKPDDPFYFWDGTLTTLNSDKSETVISIDGDLNGPYDKSLDLLLWITQHVSGINAEVQQKAIAQFPDKSIDLTADFTIDDISIYKDKDGDFEIEYNSDENGMLSVNFKDGKVLKMELY
jgi:hypothetical protein